MNPEDFNIEEIEQMNPEFKPCDCEDGTVSNGIYRFTCPKCHGTTEIVVKEESHENL